MKRQTAFRPQSRALALEPRILFDGAAAVAVDQQADAAQAPQATHPATEAPPRTLVVIDTRITGYQNLADQIAKNAEVVLVNAAQDGLKAISDALAAGGKVASIQILSHGAAGEFTLGNRTVTADNLASTITIFQGWSSHLTGNADILLYGCDVGAGAAGRTLISQLAAATGADVAASTNNTGAQSAGGDWILEVSTGPIESRLTEVSYGGLLPNASPTVSLSTIAMDSLLGGQFSFTASFSNPSTQVGFAPFIDLVFPATGKDGAGPAIDDGITFVSATYLGQPVTAYVLTFDSAGKATHPLAKDSAGQAVIVNAASYGAQSGDQLVVLQLPFASNTNAQPAIPVVITAQLSDLADTDGSPDLTIQARGGFQYGNDSADNPTTDPALFQASMQSLVIHPTYLHVTQTVDTPESETATGPNFMRTVTVTVTPPLGQALSNVDMTQAVPNNVRVSAITPGAGGTLTSITVGGSTLTDPAAISAAMALNPYLTSYTVRYASLTAPTNTVLTFYVPEKDATGANVLNPVFGDALQITFAAPTASGQWLPLDPRDQTTDPLTGTPIPAIVSAHGVSASFFAKSVALRKDVTIAANAGNPGLSPGDTLQYTLNLDISDYFAMGKTMSGSGNPAEYLNIVDTLADGQSVVANSAQVTLRYNGQTISLPIGVSIATGALGSGTSVVTFDMAQWLIDANAATSGALIGDLAFDSVINGATQAVVTYRTTVNQAYSTSYAQSEINEGDSVNNSATVSGTLLSSYVSLTGGTETDSSAAWMTVPTHTVQGEIVAVNGGTPPPNGELRPGDTVTFKLSYDLQTGDYENFKLTAYLPLPIFDLSGITWTPGTGIGQWAYGSGNTNLDPVNTVSSASGNAIVFDFGSYATADLAGKRIEVQFTLQVGNQPFADQRSLTVLAQSDQLTTMPAQLHLISSGVINIASLATPALDIKHGVVSVGTGSTGVVSGTTGTWAIAGSTGAPFSGTITNLLAVEGSVVGIDGGDLVRLATALENTGGLGAFGVTTDVTLPTDFTFVGGSLLTANTKVYRGNGTQLIAGTDYSIAGSTVTFLDPAGQPSMLPGRNGTANDASGANVIVITYDVVASNTIAASQSLETTAALTGYSSSVSGPNFAPTALTDKATETVAAPSITQFFANGSISNDDSSAIHTTGTNLVIGESMLYDIVVKLPEGQTQTLRIDDLIPNGFQLDTAFGTGGYQLITTVAGSAALTADFLGTVSVSGIAATPAGTLGANGVDARLSLSAASPTADNLAGNNSFVVRLRLIASNTSTNQTGTSLVNSAQLIYSDPDGNTPNGSTPQDRTVALSGSAPVATVREPTLAISQTATTNGSGLPGQVDSGDTVTYTITISNGSSASDFDAFDLGLVDVLPTELDNLTIQSVVYSAGATNHGGPDFTLSGSTLTTAGGANIDIAKGGSIALTVSGQVNASVANVASFTNSASVQWTSLDGSNATPQPGERTGVDGILNSGALNDYQRASNVTLQVVAGATISHVGGLADTPAPNPTDQAETVSVGEIIRYRVGFVLAEGTITGAMIKLELPNGLSYINDGSTTVGLLSNVAVTYAPDLTTGSNPGLVGSVASLPDLLAADLSNTMTAVLNPTRINTTNPNQIVFSLGNLQNNDQDNLNKEVVYLDFNVRVDNTAAVDTSKTLSTSAKFFSNNGSTQIGETLPIAEAIVEPNLSNLQKTVTDFNPNMAGATGTATVTVSFSNTGDGVAYDSHLSDTMDAGSNYVLQSVSINGATYLPGALPAGVTVATTGAITADFDSLAAGATVKLVYTVDVPNSVTHASTDATLTWSSLPESFTSYAGSSVGPDASASGERDGSGTAPNTYISREGAGLGLITGRLWDDTASATSGTTPDGPGIAGRTVTLTWAGEDGALGTVDDKTFTATTDASGTYQFGVLAAGSYKINAAPTIANHNFGSGSDPIDTIAARIDSDSVGNDATVAIPGLGEGATRTAHVGYVRENDAPVNTVPAGPITLPEDNQPLLGQPPGLPLALGGISVSDVDAGSGTLQVTVTVLHGTVNLTNTSGLTSTNGLGTATMVLTGSQTALNTALATLTYMPSVNYNGNDTLTVRTSDRGQLGDANNNGTPGENPGDALLDTDTVALVITPVNDAPSGVNDLMLAVEAGGVSNSQGGLTGTANVLSNDTDVDFATNGDVLKVTRIGVALPTVNVASGTTLTALTGTYGTLRINSLGDAVYEIDNANAAVEALRLSTNTLSETFVYELQDLAGETSTATITVTIRGNNDTPVGVDDSGTAYEAGGVANGSGGSNGTGNVLTNDVDVDSTTNGETRVVTAITNSASVSGTLGASLAGTYGSVTLLANGSYTYVVDNNNATVQGLRSSADTLTDSFTYTLRDTAGASASATLNITIRGANDNPIAVNDTGSAIEAGGVRNGTPGSPATGNVLFNDTDVDNVAYGETKTVSAIRTGADPGSGTVGSPGSALSGTYGALTLNPNGSYTYVVDDNNATVQSLRSSANTLTDSFTYTMRDTAGATSSATLTVTIRGANDAPDAVDDVGTVVDPAAVYGSSMGNVLPNDHDVDAYGETKTVAGFANAAGATTAAGSRLAGSFGNLVLNADGSYTYLVFDPDATIRATGAAPKPGTVSLVETFVYTVRDAAGATAQATLRMNLDVATPRTDLPLSPFFGANDPRSGREIPVLNFTPMVFVERAVEQIERNLKLSDRHNDGARPAVAAWPEMQVQSLAAGLGQIRDTFVQQVVRDSQFYSRYDASTVDSRAGLISLSADGVLPDDSLFTPDREVLPDALTGQPLSKHRPAPSFSEQLKQSANRSLPWDTPQSLQRKPGQHPVPHTYS